MEDEEPTINKNYPKAIDMDYLNERIHMPLNNFEMKFKKGAGYSLLKEMIQTKIMEESVSESPFKKHIVKKFIDG